MIDFDSHDILEPDSVLASQFFAPKTALPEPERSLMVAVLADAVRCFLDHYRATDQKKRVLYQDAKEWLLCTEHAGLYTFENVCAVLDLDAGSVRRQLLAKRDQARATEIPDPAPSNPRRRRSRSRVVTAAAPQRGTRDANRALSASRAR